MSTQERLNKIREHLTLTSPEAEEFVMYVITHQLYRAAPKYDTIQTWRTRLKTIKRVLFRGETAAAIAEEEGITRQAVSYRIGTAMKHINQRYEQATGKPAPKLGRSLGITREVILAAKQGQSAEEIKKNLNISSNDLATRRKITKEYGIKLPLITFVSERLAAADTILRTSQDYNQLQKVLEQLNYNSCRTLRETTDPCILTIEEFLGMMGISFYSPKLPSVLMAAIIQHQIPHYEKKYRGKKQTYRYFYLPASIKDDIIAVLSSLPEVQRPVANQVSVKFLPEGLSVHIPNQHELVNTGSYRALSQLVKRVYTGPKKKLDDILGENCPVPIFFLNSSHYFLASQKAELEEYLISLNEQS